MRRSIHVSVFMFSLMMSLALSLYSQQDNAWIESFEMWQEEFSDEKMGNEMADIYEQFVATPFNLNDTVSNRLLLLPFVSEFHLRAIRAYIQQYGQLYSVDELLLVNGFNSSLVALLRPLVVAEPFSLPYKMDIKSLFQSGKSSLLLGSGGGFGRSRGFVDDVYAGGDYRLYARYSYVVSNHLHFQLSVDNDPGEPLPFSGSTHGFDYYGGFLSLSNLGCVKNVVVGQYNLQFGQGLTLWSGFAPYSSLIADASRNARGIANASAFAEYGSLNGVAATVQLSNHLSFSPFFSYASLDATISDDGNIQSISQSGYHRTPSERAKKDNVSETLFGGHLQFDASNIQVGLTFAHDAFSDSIRPKYNRYNYYTFSGDGNYDFGLDFRYTFHRLLFYGEASMSAGGGLAMLLGATFFLHANHQFGLLYRDYDVDYCNLHASPYMRGSLPSNEKGLVASYQTLLPFSITALFQVDMFRFPYLRYNVYSPSSGLVCRCSLQRSMGRGNLLNVSYYYRSRGENSSSAANEYVVEQTFRHQLSLKFQSEYLSWLFVSRFARSWFDAEYSPFSCGMFLSQDVTYQFSKPDLSLSLRFLFFDVDSYDARLYAAESDMAYQLSSTMYNGVGRRLYAVLRYRLSNSLVLAAKYAVTSYANVKTVGSGYDQVDGNHRQSWKLQLRWSF